MNGIYVAVDGDSVGSRIEYFVINNNVADLHRFCDRFEGAMGWLEEALVDGSGAQIVFRGGDNLMAFLSGSKSNYEALEGLRQAFAVRSGCTLSMGTGASAREAYLALKLAKSDGKNLLRRFEDLDCEP